MTEILRDRIAAALREHHPPTHVDPEGLPADEFECCADAVMAVAQPEFEAAVRRGMLCARVQDALTRAGVTLEEVSTVHGADWPGGPLAVDRLEAAVAGQRNFTSLQLAVIADVTGTSVFALLGCDENGNYPDGERVTSSVTVEDPASDPAT